MSADAGAEDERREPAADEIQRAAQRAAPLDEGYSRVQDEG
jgi:hypothetical protein